MKKFAILVVALLLASALYAANFTVKSANGKIQRETPEGSTPVLVGQVLTEATRVSVGLNAELVVVGEDGKTVRIKSLRSGTMEELVRSAGLKINGKIVKMKETKTTGIGAPISTASTRASDAAGDVDWAE
jgi:hypothetical protein